MAQLAALAAVTLTLATTLPAQALTGAALRDSARARLARLDGTVEVAGLDSTVEVRRDRWGVPHIYAKTRHDLFLAQGYVAAQDRLWQMEMWRRSGDGRLAEVIGPSAVERDRFARLLKYRGDMAREWVSYSPDTREIVQAFVAGVNAYIAQVRSRPPIEFTLLAIAPEPWTVEVPLQRMAALVSFRPSGDPVELVQRLEARGVIVRELPGRNLVRASCGWWTSDDDLERLLEGVLAETPPELGK